MTFASVLTVLRNDEGAIRPFLWFHAGVFDRYDRGRLMIVSPESSPRESLHLPRQKKMFSSDGKSDGKGPSQSTPIPLTMRVCVTC